MRHIRSGTRIGGIAILCGVLLAAPACTTDQADTQATPNATATTTGSAAPTDVAGNTQLVCTEVRKLLTDGAAEFSRRLSQALSAAESGAVAGDAAVKELKDLLAQWAAGLRTQAGMALDPSLKTALTTEADAFDRAAAKINTRDDLKAAGSVLTSQDVTQAGQAVQQACGSYWAK
jgi:hypothetical protein